MAASQGLAATPAKRGRITCSRSSDSAQLSGDLSTDLPLSPARAASSPATSRCTADQEGACRRDCDDQVTPGRSGHLTHYCPGADRELAVKLLTRRCLVEQLSCPEVFNIAGDEAVAKCSNANLRRSSGPRALSADGGPKSSGYRQLEPRALCLDDEQACESCGPAAEDADGAVDVWGLEDWSPVSRSHQCEHQFDFSPVSDRSLREVADSVSAEVRMDLQPIVQDAVDHLKSWIIEEIAFARQGFAEDMQKQSQELQEIRSKEEAKLNDLQSRMEEQMRLSIKTQEQVDGLPMLQGKEECATIDKVDAVLQLLETQAKSAEESLTKGLAQLREEILEQLQSKVDDTIHSEALAGLGRPIVALEQGLSKTALEMSELARSTEHLDLNLDRVKNQLGQINVHVQKKADYADVERVFETFATWEKDTSRWLEQVWSSMHNQTLSVDNHEAWIQSLSEKFDEARRREQGVCKVLYHVAEQSSSPALMNLCQVTFGL